MNDGKVSLKVPEYDEIPGVTYILSTNIENNSRGRTTSVKAHINYQSDVDSDPTTTLRLVQAINDGLLTAGELNIAMRSYDSYPSDAGSLLDRFDELQNRIRTIVSGSETDGDE